MTKTSDRLKVHQLSIAGKDNFIYLLADTQAKRAIVVDPAWDASEIHAEIDRLGYTLQAIWLTHGHFDHTNAVSDLLAQHAVPLYLNRAMPAKWRPAADQIVEFTDGDVLHVGELAFDVLHTPGHSPDGSCFLHGDQLIAGDTLFIDGCGRCDLPDSDVHAMYQSIHNRLMKLPDETVIYPGHDYGPRPNDTLRNQKQSNRFMRAHSQEDFVRERLG